MIVSVTHETITLYVRSEGTSWFGIPGEVSLLASFRKITLQNFDSPTHGGS